MTDPSFSATTEDALRQAAALCLRRGARLTGLRSLVLGLVIDSKRPLGAYDLLEKLRAYHKGSTPPTIYRALDFLRSHGLIHKIERLAAFVGCVHGGGADDHAHSVGFLICSVCNRALEIEDARLERVLSDVASAVGFGISTSIIEIEGVCATCRRDAHNLVEPSLMPRGRTGRVEPSH